MARGPLGHRSYQLRGSLSLLHDRMKPLNRITFTHDEFLALFSPPEHWEILKTAGEVAQVSGGGGFHGSAFKHKTLAAENVEVSFQVHDVDNNAPLMPRNQVILKSAPKELVTRLVEWANRGIEVAFGFGEAQAVMDWLEANCETAGQIRFLWPSIVPLCSLNEYTHPLGERLKEFRPKHGIPAIPDEVRAACKASSGLIAGAMLLPEEPEPVAPAQVTARITGGEAKRVQGALGHVSAF